MSKPPSDYVAQAIGRMGLGPLALEIDAMLDVYMTTTQREAYNRILDTAKRATESPARDEGVSNQAVAGLVGKWREQATALENRGYPSDIDAACALRSCADELSTALAAQPCAGVGEDAVERAMYAERYRWLRDDAMNARIDAPACVRMGEWGSPGPIYGADLDAAIDAAIQQEADHG